MFLVTRHLKGLIVSRSTYGLGMIANRGLIISKKMLSL